MTDAHDELNSRLYTVIKLMAALFVRGLNNTDAIVKLDKMQLNREQIAQAVGVTTHNVAQVLYASKKMTGKKKANGALAKVDGKEAVAAPEMEV